MTKIKELLSSVRFQQLVVVAVIQSLVLFGVITTDKGQGLIDIISALLVGSVAIGTVDKFSTPTASKTSKKK